MQVKSLPSTGWTHLPGLQGTGLEGILWVTLDCQAQAGTGTRDLSRGTRAFSRGTKGMQFFL